MRFGVARRIVDIQLDLFIKHLRLLECHANEPYPLTSHPLRANVVLEALVVVTCVEQRIDVGRKISLRIRQKIEKPVRSIRLG